MFVDPSRRWRRSVLGYLAALVVAEIVVSKWSVPAGVACHGVLLLVLLNHYAAGVSAGPMIDEPKSRADQPWSSLLVLTLIPILRIASVTMPNTEVSPILWYALTVLPLALGIVLIARLLGAGRGDLALRWTASQPVIALIGVPLAFVAVELPQAGPVIKSDDWWYLLGASVVLLLLGGVEEVVFRGMIQGSLCRLFGARGLALTATLSTVAATGSGSLPFVIFSGGAALLFGWLVYRTRSLVGAAIAHGIVNVTAILLLGASPRLNL